MTPLNLNLALGPTATWSGSSQTFRNFIPPSLSSGWYESEVTFTSGAPDKDGGTTATYFAPTTNSDTHWCGINAIGTGADYGELFLPPEFANAAGDWRFTALLKDDGARYIDFFCYGLPNYDSGVTSIVDLVSGTLEDVDIYGPDLVSASHSLTDLGSGWFRLTVDFALASSATGLGPYFDLYNPSYVTDFVGVASERVIVGDMLLNWINPPAYV